MVNATVAVVDFFVETDWRLVFIIGFGALARLEKKRFNLE